MSSRQGGGGGSPKDDLLHRPYTIKKTTRGGGGQKLPILRRHSLWTATEYVQLKGKVLPDKKIFTIISNMTLYGIRKAPPPFSWANLGNLQTLPKPTA